MLNVMHAHSEVVNIKRHTACSGFTNVPSFIFPQQKLPFTIPELVQASPCRSSDGVLYMGKANAQKRNKNVALSPHIKEQVFLKSSSTFRFYAICGLGLCSFEFETVNRGKVIYQSDCVIV